MVWYIRSLYRHKLNCIWAGESCVAWSCGHIWGQNKVTEKRTQRDCWLKGRQSFRGQTDKGRWKRGVIYASSKSWERVRNLSDVIKSQPWRVREEESVIRWRQKRTCEEKDAVIPFWPSATCPILSTSVIQLYFVLSISLFARHYSLTRKLSRNLACLLKPTLTFDLFKFGEMPTWGSVCKKKRPCLNGL